MIKIKLIVLAFAIFMILPIVSWSQSIGINDDNSEPDERTILDVKSNSKGVLLPRLTDEERDSLFIDVPPGMLIFNTTDLGSGLYDNVSNFHELKEHVYYWTSALENIGQPYYFKLNYDNSNLDNGSMQSDNLATVRCVRNNYE